MNEFSYDLAGLVKFEPGEEFLGLYRIGNKHVIWIISPAGEATAGFRFLTKNASPHPHYVPDPIAWAELPHVGGPGRRPPPPARHD